MLITKLENVVIVAFKCTWYYPKWFENMYHINLVFADWCCDRLVTIIHVTVNSSWTTERLTLLFIQLVLLFVSFFFFLVFQFLSGSFLSLKRNSLEISWYEWELFLLIEWWTICISIYVILGIVFCTCNHCGQQLVRLFVEPWSSFLCLDDKKCWGVVSCSEQYIVPEWPNESIHLFCCNQK